MTRKKSDQMMSSGPKIPPRAFIYARVSSREQENEGFSIDAQIDLLREYAIRRGFSVIREVEEAFSAKESGRPAFGAILKDAQAMLKSNPGSTVALLVEKMDRLTRNFYDYIKLDEMVKAGFSIHFAKEGAVWDEESRAHDKLMLGIRALLARDHIENLGEEVKKGLKAKALQGLWPTRVAIGYMNDKATKTIVPDPQSAPMIRTLFAWAASGRYTLATLSDMAFNDGLRTRAGKKVHKTVIHWILHNPIYSGCYSWRGGPMVQGSHEPLVSTETFKEVQTALDQKAKPQSKRHHFLFTGMMTCANCGCTITGQIQKKRYVYYRCAQGRGKCKSAEYATEESLVVQFGEALKSLRIADSAVTYVRNKLLKSHEGRAKEQAAALVRDQTRYTKLGDMKGRAYRDSLEGHVTMAEFLKTKAELETEMAQIETRMAAVRRTDGKAMVEGVKIIDAVRHAHETFMRAGQLEKRKILDLLLSNPMLDGKKAVIKWKSPFHWMEGASRSDWLPGLDSNQQPFD